MKWVSYKQILTWGWDNITVLDWNGAEVHYWAASISFTTEFLLRWKDGQEEIQVTPDMSPMEIEGATNNWFPYQIKWTWDLFILTMN